MKTYIAIPILLFLTCFSLQVLAQTCYSVNCNTDPVYYNSITQTFNFSDWDWTNQDVCNWKRYPSGVATCTTPPFGSGATLFGKMIAIKNDTDYVNSNPAHLLSKDKGWELVYANFNTANPYFFLYNKYRGVLRTFFYIDTPSSTFSRYLVSCKITGPVPANLNIGIDPINALDKYPSVNNNDVMIAVTTIGTQSTWICSDFNMLFDPSVTSSTYLSSNLQVILYGVSDYQITLNGTALQDGDYTMVASSSAVQQGSFNAATANAKLKQILDGGQAVLDQIKADSILIPSTTNPVLLKHKAILGAANTMTTLTKVFQKAAAVSSTISVVMSLYEIFAGKAPNSQESGPQAMNFNLALSGSMTLSAPISGNGNIKLPGRPVGGTSANNLYDCPMGIINLNNTIEILTSPTYNRCQVDAAYTTQGGYNGKFQKCKVNTTPQFSINNIGSMQLVDLKCAIIFKPKYVATPNSPSPGYCPTDEIIYTGQTNIPYPIVALNQPNPVYNDILTEKLSLYKNEADGRHKFGTPYLDPACINGLTFEIPTETDISFSYIAIFKVTASNTPVIFKYEYSVKSTFVDNAAPNNLIIGLSEYPHAFLYTGYYNNAYVLNNTNANYSTPYTGWSVNMQSGTGTTGTHFIPGFQATAVPKYNCTGTLNITNYAYSNCANSQSFRFGDLPPIDVEHERILVYPNPSGGYFTLSLQFPDAIATSCSIYNSMGQEVYSNYFGELQTLEKLIDLNAQSGLYLIKIKHGDTEYQEKILISK